MKATKYLIQLITLAGVIGFTGCEKDDSVTPNEDFAKQLEAVAGSQEAPQEAEVQSAEWKCSAWDVNFYKDAGKVGDWDGFTNTIKEDEKQQVYLLNDGKFKTYLTTQLKSTNTKNEYNYTWKEGGILIIDGIGFTIKDVDNQLIVYYNITDAAKVAQIFNVTIDNTYGQSGKDEANLTGLGIIKLKERNPADDQTDSDLSTEQLVKDFLAKKAINGGVYESIEKEGQNVFILSKGTSIAQALRLSNMNGIEISNLRAQLLFNNFLFAGSFNVLNEKIIVNQIEFAPESTVKLIVRGYTQKEEEVSFYYNIDADEQSWIKAPESPSSNEIAAYDLAQKFNDRKELLGSVFSTIETTSDAYTFKLDGIKQVVLANQSVDVSNVTSERAKNLYSAFFKKTAYLFKGMGVLISKITHERSDVGGSLVVTGVTNQKGETVKFYIDTNSDKQYWLSGPVNSAQKVFSYELATKFLNKTVLLDYVFESIETTNVNGLYLMATKNSENLVYVMLDGDLDLSNVTPERYKDLMTKFFTGSVMVYGDNEYYLNKIEFDRKTEYVTQFKVYKTYILQGEDPYFIYEF